MLIKLTNVTVPQLIFQAMYVFAIGGITQTAAFATGASVLSVISALLSFVIERRDGDVTVVQYFLSLHCERGAVNPTSRSPSPIMINSVNSIASTPGSE